MPLTKENLIQSWNIDCSQTVGIIFDIDELLFDNSKDLFMAYRSLLDRRNIRMDINERFAGKDLFAIIEGIRNKYGISDSVEALVKERRNTYIDLLKNTTSIPKTGVYEVFNFIEENRSRLNIRVGYASSSERAFLSIILKKIIDHCGLPQYADNPDRFFYFNEKDECASTCWEQGLAKKPSPDVYLKTLNKLGLSPTQCLAFEDSQSGLESALAAGLKVVIIPSPSHRETFKNLRCNELNSQGVCRMDSLLDFVPILESLIQP